MRELDAEHHEDIFDRFLYVFFRSHDLIGTLAELETFVLIPSDVACSYWSIVVIRRAVGEAAEVADELTSAIDELHEGVDVGFASLAADWFSGKLD
jgi:hypothetical protein